MTSAARDLSQETADVSATWAFPPPFVLETTRGRALWRRRSQVGRENSASGSILRNKWTILRVSSRAFFCKHRNMACKPIAGAGDSAP
jgi:hypothetical protein